MSQRKTVIVGLLGSVLDSGFHEERWNRWRPTVSLCRHNDLPISRFELIHLKTHQDTAKYVAADIQRVCSNIEVRLTLQELTNPWDFEEEFERHITFARHSPLLLWSKTYWI